MEQNTKLNNEHPVPCFKISISNETRNNYDNNNSKPLESRGKFTAQYNILMD